jgi:hypothetical protein
MQNIWSVVDLLDETVMSKKICFEYKTFMWSQEIVMC